MPTARSCRHSNSLFHEPLHFSRDPRAPQQAPARSSASGLMTHHTIVEHGAPGWLAVLPAVPPVAGMKAAGARDTARPRRPLPPLRATSWRRGLAAAASAHGSRCSRLADGVLDALMHVFDEETELQVRAE